MRSKTFKLKTLEKSIEQFLDQKQAKKGYTRSSFKSVP